MPLLTDTPSMVRCPNVKCNASGPYNFRLEQRGTFKRPDPSKPQFVDLVGSIDVWACVKCGTILQEVK